MALFAEGILKSHWDQTIPVNLAHIAKGMGVAVVLRNSLDATALLEILHDNRPRLTLDPGQASMRQRCAAAHALGHVALHHLRPGMQRRIDLSDDYRIDHNQRHNSEANDFALQLLIPTPALHFALGQMQARDLAELGHLFEVPPLLIKQRLADLNLDIHTPLAQQSLTLGAVRAKRDARGSNAQHGT